MSELTEQHLADLTEKWRKEARDIWQDGFEAGEAHGNLRYKYPPMVIAWLFSDVWKNVGSENTEAQEALRVRWTHQNYNERESTVVRWSDLEKAGTHNEDEPCAF